MIDAASALSTLLLRLGNLPVGHALEIRTYKRNRGALLVRLAEDRYRVQEQGYQSSETEVAGPDLRKVLKAVLAREFPRSTKIRLYTLGLYGPAVDNLERKKL